MRRGLAVILFLVALPSLWAQEEATPVIRATIEPETPVTVGEPVRLTVEVLVPTWFTGAPRYPAIDLRDAIVIFLETGGFNFTDRIEGETFAGQRRQYRIYPTRPGSLTISGENVIVSYAVNARPSPPTPYTIPDLTIEAMVPPEAEGLDYFFAATDFSLDARLDRSTDDLKVGDSLTRTITMTAEDTLAMMLPPVDFEPIEGIANYPGQPKVSDSGGERGETRVAQRVEAVTYVMQEEGDYRLPEMEIFWWDSRAARVRRETVPALAFAVAPNPSLTEEIALPPEDMDASEAETPPIAVDWRDLLRRWAAPVVVLLVIVWILTRLLRRLLPRYRAWRQEVRIRKASSETTYFERYKEASLSGDRISTYRQLMFWLDRFQTSEVVATLEGFTSSSRDPDLVERARDLSDALFSARKNDLEQPWSGRRLYRSVARVRQTSRRGEEAARSSRKSRLVPLNPCSGRQSI